MKTNKLFEAVLERDLEQIKFLLASGFDAERKDGQGRTALMEATIEGSEEIVRILMQAGANPNAHDRQGYTALHFAAQNYQPGIARVLIDGGAAVDAVDGFGNTPLWRSVFASKGRGEVIRLLLEAGADRNFKNNSGVSPLDLAQTIGNYDIGQFFAARE